MKSTAIAASLLSYALCLAAPLLYFYGRVDADAYRMLLAAGTVGWLVFATVWSGRHDGT